MPVAQKRRRRVGKMGDRGVKSRLWPRKKADESGKSVKMGDRGEKIIFRPWRNLRSFVLGGDEEKCFPPPKAQEQPNHGRGNGFLPV